MPTYEYNCSNCLVEFEKIVPFEDRFRAEKEKCPGCHSEGSVKYNISAPSIGYSHKGSMKTTDSFNDRLKEIKKGLPERNQDRINSIIR